MKSQEACTSLTSAQAPSSPVVQWPAHTTVAKKNIINCLMCLESLLKAKLPVSQISVTEVSLIQTDLEEQM